MTKAMPSLAESRARAEQNWCTVPASEFKSNPDLPGVVYKGDKPPKWIQYRLGSEWSFVGPTEEPQYPGCVFVQMRYSLPIDRNKPMLFFHENLSKFGLLKNGWKALNPGEWRWWP